jgi:sugar phosphate isomerase/epimerase
MASPEEEWKWAVEGLREVYSHSEKAGVVLGLEPLNPLKPTSSTATIRLCCWRRNSPNCGICLDTFHINIEEADLHQAILSTGKVGRLPRG